MIKEIKTLYDAAHEWVREFNAFPLDMIMELSEHNPEDFEEVTLPSKGDRVYISKEDEECSEGEILNYFPVSDTYEVRLDNGNVVEFYEDEIIQDVDDYFPMWGWMWQFSDSCDEYWLENKNGLRALSDAGFRVYKSEKWGYFFGIDGSGYDFYDEHWIPLYKKRGLNWHD